MGAVAAAADDNRTSGGTDEGSWGIGSQVPATLILNPNSGGGAYVDADDLSAMLEDSGYLARHIPTERPEDLDGALKEAEGVIVVAGGDGTFREVARRMVGRSNPLTLLPLGTANNTARSLGLEGPLKGLLARLRNPRRMKLDVATARGPWGEEFMLEGAGLGVFANILAEYNPGEGKNLLRALRAAAQALDEQNAVRCRIEIDERSYDGEYLLVEALNMRAVGPRLALAPDADPSDGLLDIILVRYENHDAFAAYLRRMMTHGLADLESVEVVRGKRVRINWRGSAFHVDAETLCKEARTTGSKGFSAQIEIVPAALDILLPSKVEG